MKTMPGAPQQQYEPVDCDTDKVPPNISDAYEITLPHLPAFSEEQRMKRCTRLSLLRMTDSTIPTQQDTFELVKITICA